jgi:hypothetical protein
MIRQYDKRDWSEICRVFDLAKPYELATGRAGESFVPLADDDKRIASFAESTVFVWEEKGKLKGFIGHEGAYISWLFVDPAAFRRRHRASTVAPRVAAHRSRAVAVGDEGQSRDHFVMSK